MTVTSIRRVSASLALVLAVVLTGITGAGATGMPGAPPARAGWTPPTHERTIGKPGHAGVYAWGAATAPDGTIVIGDYWNYVVRRYSTSGSLLATMSSKGRADGQNGAPHGVGVDPVDGSIYIADMNHPDHRIIKLDKNGRFVRNIATYVYGVTVPYAYVTHITVAPNRELIAVSSHNVPSLFATVLVFSPDGVFKRAITGAGSELGQLGLLHGVAADAAGNTYVADATKGLIQVFDADGDFVRAIGSRGTGAGRFQGDMRGLAIDQDNGWIYASDTEASQIEKFTLTGTHLATFGSEGVGPGQFRDGGRELTVGKDHNLYAPDFGNNRVIVFSPTGAVVRTFPDPAPQAPDGGFNEPQGVAVSPATGHVYVADTFNHRIQQFTAAGGFVRAWGFRGSTDPYALNYPRGVDVDPGTGSVWVANTRQGNIKRFTPTGSYLSQFGRWGSGSGQYQLERDLVVTGARIYHADSNNKRVVATSKTGQVLWSRPCGVTFVPGQGTGLLQGCTGIDVDDRGRVYAAAITENAVYVFAPNGTLLRKVKGVTRPYDVAVSGSTVYVAESMSGRVAAYTTDFVRLGTFGDTGSAAQRVDTPHSLAVDATGAVYVVDSAAERVQVYR